MSIAFHHFFKIDSPAWLADQLPRVADNEVPDDSALVDGSIAGFPFADFGNVPTHPISSTAKNHTRGPWYLTSMKPVSHHKESRKPPGFLRLEAGSKVKWGRWWLSLVYLLATLMAQGVHDHGRGIDDLVPESMGDCDDPRPHVADHEVGDRGIAPTACPSCQFRSQQSLWVMASRPVPGPSVAVPLATSRPSTLPGSPLRTRCRAPPRV